MQKGNRVKVTQPIIQEEGYYDAVQGRTGYVIEANAPGPYPIKVVFDGEPMEHYRVFHEDELTVIDESEDKGFLDPYDWYKEYLPWQEYQGIAKRDVIESTLENNFEKAAYYLDRLKKDRSRG